MAQVICLMGPTAAGKTDLAIELVQQKPELEIISVDSAMVYRELTIGAAKPSPLELAQAPHHLLDVRSVIEPYSAADFVQDAESLMDDINQRGKTPLLVGGTMLYFKALQQGLADLPGADVGLRQRLAQQAEAEGWKALHQQLKQCDPESAERIHPNDPQRLQRALEVYYLTGKPLSAHFQEAAKQSLSYQFINIGLVPQDRGWLHERIKRRFYKMLEAGFIEEVKALYHRKDVNAELPALRTVGYRQVWQYLAGELSYEAMIEKSIVATRQLAKRQLTWLRQWPELTPVFCEEVSVQHLLDILTL